MRILIFISVMIWAGLAQSATYHYESTGFLHVENATADCPATCRNYEYATSIKGTIVTSKPFDANLKRAQVASLVTDFDFTDGFARYRKNDGRTTSDQVINVSTDSEGRVTFFSIWLLQWQTLAPQHVAGDRINWLMIGNGSAGDYLAFNAACHEVGQSGYDVCLSSGGGTSGDPLQSRAWGGFGSLIALNESDRVPVYRFFNRSTQTHFFTTSEVERNAIFSNASDNSYEGIAFYVKISTQDEALPVYRLFNIKTGEHFYTIHQIEVESILNNLLAFRNEGVAWHALKKPQINALPVYRFFNKNTGTHFYSIQDQEVQFIIANYSDLLFEGVAYYAWTTK